MNRFQVKKDRTGDFEAMWLGRDTHVQEVGGFHEFRLLRGPEREGPILYSSHTVWCDEDAFTAWTRSEAFRLAHANADHGDGEPMTLGHPQFGDFVTLQTIAREAE